ncbi:MAG: S8 family peptidase [Solirubrobacteraceae bacterium]|nr:S8 family peptidase [Solirubrobacteraceae bacterium]
MRKGLACAVVVTAALGLASSANASQRYIVELDRATGAASDRSAAIDRRLAAWQGHVERSFDHAINGLVIRLPDGLPSNFRIPGAVSVSADTTVTSQATQTSPPWGVDRIDQASLPLSRTFTYTATGAGVKAYVIDSGIRPTHADFGGRARIGYDALGGNGVDCNGHGTHVAGTIGGATYGVAKAVSLVAVRALNCQGSAQVSQIIAGIDWVIRDHASGQPAVANMSLGGASNAALDTAVTNLINDGVSVAVAAGNGSGDACGTSPAHVAPAITAAASDSTDQFASFSNHGTCVDLIAPGVGVVSAGSSSDTATATYSGTSMASPHVAGAAARLLQTNPAATPAQIQTAVLEATAPDKIGAIRSTCRRVWWWYDCRVRTPNRLLQSFG